MALALVKFDLSALPPNVTVDEAKLRLYRSSPATRRQAEVGGVTARGTRLP